MCSPCNTLQVQSPFYKLQRAMRCGVLCSKVGIFTETIGGMMHMPHLQIWHTVKMFNQTYCIPSSSFLPPQALVSSSRCRRSTSSAGTSVCLRSSGSCGAVQAMARKSLNDVLSGDRESRRTAPSYGKKNPERRSLTADRERRRRNSSSCCSAMKEKLEEMI